jgi:hypothetical protein
VATNNAETAKTATFETGTPNATLNPVYGGSGPTQTDAAGEATIEVPALGTVVYEANRTLPKSRKAPGIKVGAPATATGCFEIDATLSTGRFAEVSFAVKVGDGRFRPAGTDDSAPYRVFYDVGDIEPGTTLTIKAVVNDLNGHLRSATTETVVGG